MTGRLRVDRIILSLVAMSIIAITEGFAAWPPASIPGQVMSTSNVGPSVPVPALATAGRTNDPAVAAATLGDEGAPWTVEPVPAVAAFGASVAGRVLGVATVAAFDITAARIVIPAPAGTALAIVAALGGSLTVETANEPVGLSRGQAACVRLAGPLALTTGGCVAVVAIAPESRVGPIPAGFVAAGPFPSVRPEIRLLIGHVTGVALSAPPGETGIRETLGRHVADLAAAVARGVVPDGEVARRSTRTARLQAARQIVEANLGQPTLSVGRVARQIGVSDRYLQKLFQDAGTTFSAWLMERRLDTARRQLAADRDRALAIRDVAYACGFSDASHFTRAFRRRFGETPTALRGGADEAMEDA
jgi:AraC-like DNA-binding protein